jgi:hypothetical protein
MNGQKKTLRLSVTAGKQLPVSRRRTGKSVCHNQRTCKGAQKMRSGRFARVIQLDESGAMSGNGTSDKHPAGNDEMGPFKPS